MCAEELGGWWAEMARKSMKGREEDALYKRRIGMVMCDPEIWEPSDLRNILIFMFLEKSFICYLRNVL